MNMRPAVQTYEPPAPRLLAAAVCAAVALLLLWPLLTGSILFGGVRSDMFIAGYSFRLFGAETFKATGSLPQWNPYLFGGLPYIGAMHGDIFYPTAWLRWIMPVDLAITWGMAVHFVLAGWFTYLLGRALHLSWTGAVVAAVAYELSGIVASQMSPGHDGKLFVSALTPLAFLVLLRAVRDAKPWAWGALSFVVALVVLGHYHMAYFLLLAMGLWTLYLVFWHGERAQGVRAWRPIAMATLAVALGVGIASLQLLPFVAYIPFSPRASGGPNTGWEFATSYAFPPSEIFATLLPEFNGVLGSYWGSNPVKLHTEYLGVIPIVLAMLSFGDLRHRRLVRALALGGLLFLLFSFAGHTPFYRPFFEFMPLLDKIRAMGMVFFLVAFPVALLAGIGADRVFARAVSSRRILLACAVPALFAAAAAAGGLQGLAESLALPERLPGVAANAEALQRGALRLLLFTTACAALLWAIRAARAGAMVGATALLALLAADLWATDRKFFEFSPRADTLFANDAVTSYLQRVAPPYRVLDAANSYSHAILMAYRIPTVLGYHGFELRAYDELGGLDEGWRNLGSPNLQDLLAVRFLILDQAQPVRGFHEVVAATPTAFGTTAVLYERDSVPAYARVLLAAAKVPEAQEIPTLLDSRFPVDQVLLLPDSSSADIAVIQQPFPISAVRATVSSWAPGRMTIALDGVDRSAGHLLVSENWYPDWHALVDGRRAEVRRADHSLISVDLPAGAKTVELRFESAHYATGRWISLLCLILASGLTLLPVMRARRRGEMPATP